MKAIINQLLRVLGLPPFPVRPVYLTEPEENPRVVLLRTMKRIEAGDAFEDLTPNEKTAYIVAALIPTPRP